MNIKDKGKVGNILVSCWILILECLLEILKLGMAI